MGLSTHSRKGLKITEECWKAEVIGRLGNPVSVGNYRRVWEPEGGITRAIGFRVMQGITGDLEFRGKRSTGECWREAGNPGSIRFNTSFGITEKNL